MTMTSGIKLSTSVAIGALLAAPLAMAQQQSGDAGTSQGMSGSTKTNLNRSGTDHDTGMANANGTSYHFNGQKNFSGNTNNGWNPQNTGDTAPNNPQSAAVNSGGQSNSNNR